MTWQPMDRQKHIHVQEFELTCRVFFLNSKHRHIRYGLSPFHTKVSKGAKIRNRYNLVPHTTQDTNGKVTNSQLDTTNESQEGSLSQQVTTRHI